MTRLTLGIRLALVIAAFAALAPVQLLAIRLLPRLAATLPIRFHRLILRLFDVRVVCLGTPPRDEPVLVLANHVSWLDIPVISSLLPVSFVAKKEIRSWPLVGWAARLQRCVFLDRDRKAATAEANAEIAARLNGGDAIVLFPEGTTGDGNRLLPFRSSIVGAARAALAASGLPEVRLQPLALAYVRRNGLPVGRAERPDIAWYGDTELAPHLAAFARKGPVDVVVAWGEPIPFAPDADRKRATALAERRVRDGIRGAGGPKPAAGPPASASALHHVSALP